MSLNLPAKLVLSMTWLLLPLACLAGEAPATADIHVCIDAGGHVAYQSMPCANGQRTRAVRSYRAQAVDPALATRTREIEREMDQRNRGASTARTPRANGSAKRAPDPCKAAKAKRKATLDRVGLKRNYDLLSQLDREVWEVCKGF
ncbi:MAG: DUF4124 domain-containing protein [Lysobacter sp.]|nr:DUF4124 domain-containing protein [Lysobacter sp.]